MRGFVSYLKLSVWDMLLCAIASGSFLYVLCTGFDSARPLQQSPWIIAAVAVIGTIAMFCAAYNSLSALAGGAIIVLAVVGATVACWSASGAPGILDDVVGNNATFVLIAAISVAAVFLLSRRKWTTLILIAGGLILCAAIEYLYFLGHIIPTLVFGITAATLYAYRNYQNNLIGSDSEKISFGSATVASLLTAALACSLGAGVFCLCIAPLNPPHVVIKLLTKHMRLDEEEVRGIGDNVSVVNDKLFSTNTSDMVINASGEGDVSQQQNMDDVFSDPSSKSEVKDAGSSLNANNKSNEDAGNALNTSLPDWAWVAIPLAIILLVAAIIGGRKALRKRKLDRILALPPKERVQSLFMYFMDGFKKMKMPLPGTNTLFEYQTSANSALCRFEQTDTTPAFNEVLSIYNACAYGPVKPSEEQAAACKQYYDDFHRRACKQSGPLKYVPLFFRI